MLRVVVSLILTLGTLPTAAQMNRAPWVAPFLQSAPRSGTFMQAPARAPYLGSGSMPILGGDFRRTPSYMSPWGYSPYSRGMGRNNGFGSLLSSLMGMLGGGGRGSFGGLGGLGSLSGLFSGLFSQGSFGSYPPPISYPPARTQPTYATSTSASALQSSADTYRDGDTARSDGEGEFTPQAPQNPADDAVQVTPDTLTGQEQNQVAAIDAAEREAQRAPVWEPFLARFQQCAPGCDPIGYSAWRKSTRSCHGEGRALDLFGMRCADGNHMAIHSGRNQGRFAALVQCLSEGRINRVQRLAPGELGCLWHNGSEQTAGHRDHVHVSIGCKGGRRW